MDFDWTTFILEIINFLILVWILKRFLYQPILDIIDKRRADIDQGLADAQRIEEEAKVLKQKNEQFLAAWGNEKEAAHAQLTAELAEIRERKLAELDQKISEEAERRRILEERRQSGYDRLVEERAVAQGVLFASHLLSRLATPELETQLFKLLLEDLANLDKEDKHAIAEAAGLPDTQIIVTSAFPLSNDRQATLKSILSEIAGKELSPIFQRDDELMAGIQIKIGPWVLHANLRDELKFFSKPKQHEK